MNIINIVEECQDWSVGDLTLLIRSLLDSIDHKSKPEKRPEQKRISKYAEVGRMFVLQLCGLYTAKTLRQLTSEEQVFMNTGSCDMTVIHHNETGTVFRVLGLSVFILLTPGNLSHYANVFVRNTNHFTVNRLAGMSQSVDEAVKQTNSMLIRLIHQSPRVVELAKLTDRFPSTSTSVTLSGVSNTAVNTCGNLEEVDCDVDAILNEGNSSAQRPVTVLPLMIPATFASAGNHLKETGKQSTVKSTKGSKHIVGKTKLEKCTAAADVEVVSADSSSINDDSAVQPVTADECDLVSMSSFQTSDSDSESISGVNGLCDSASGRAINSMNSTQLADFIRDRIVLPTTPPLCGQKRDVETSAATIAVDTRVSKKQRITGVDSDLTNSPRLEVSQAAYQVPDSRIPEQTNKNTEVVWVVTVEDVEEDDDDEFD